MFDNKVPHLVCPKCKSEMIFLADTEMDYGDKHTAPTIYKYYECNECECFWREDFTFSRSVLIKEVD
jgi:hypothetical protein